MEDKGLMKSQFVTIHKSFRVNKKYIQCYHKKDEHVEIIVFDEKQDKMSLSACVRKLSE
jgi:DNA-binding LytR/AlgR family response regulator